MVIRVRGTPIADFVLSRSDELMQKGAEQWRRLVLAAPDPRLVALVRAKLPLDQPAINEAAYCLFRLLDSNDPCPCGSGKKYKKCCMPWWAWSDSLHNRSRAIAEWLTNAAMANMPTAHRSGVPAAADAPPSSCDPGEASNPLLGGSDVKQRLKA